MKPITEEILVDYLAGELLPAERALVTTALAEDPALFSQLSELEELMSEVTAAEEPTLPETADVRFLTMLDEAVETAPEQEATVRPLAIYQRPLFRRLTAAAAILLIFTVGYNLGTVSGGEELAAHRTLMLEYMDAERPSERMRATTVTLDLKVADAETIHNLSYMLRNDASTNVRLAALEALLRFSSDPAVADELLVTMDATPPDVVRFEIIEALVRMNETRLLPYLHDMMDADTLPQPVRDAAQMASFKLI